jgi:hypothetical protein
MQTRSNHFKWFTSLQVFLFGCIAAVAILFHATASADFSNEVIITAYDGASGDDFGHSVSIDGDSLLVGAFDDNGTGSAYVYVRNPATDTWSLQQKIPAPPGSGGMDWFGYSVSISGDTALIGVGRDDDQAENSGSAFVYVRDPVSGTWSQQQKLLPSDGGFRGYFGNAVSVDGDTAIVGATGAGGMGAAYVFVRDPATSVWSEQQKMVASGVVASLDGFGTAVFVEGDRAIVGATGNDEGANDGGAAYVFVRDVTNTWSLEQKLLATDASFNAAFGVSVTFDGDTALVGAFLDPEKGSSAGAAYIFTHDASSGNWTQHQKLLASDGAGFHHFGRSVALEGDTAIAGADRVDTAYVSARDTVTDVWTENQKITASVLVDDYALAMSISGHTLAIGSPGASRNGAVFIYTSAIPVSQYTIGGAVSGLAGSGLVLQNNGGDNLSIGLDGQFTFATALDDGSDFLVTVLTQPTLPNQTCTVNNGSGKLAGGNIDNVAITCVMDATDQTITEFTATPPNGVVGGSSVLSATASSGLAVSFDSATPGVCSVTGSTVIYSVSGICTVTANQAGDASYNPAPQVTLDIGVGLTDQVIINFLAAPDTGVVNGSSTLTATGGASGNPVIFGSNTLAVCTVISNTVTYLAAGTCKVTADQAGNANYNAAPQVSLNITVAKADQTITGLVANPATGVVEGISALSATASSGLTVSFGSSTPTVCAITGTTVNYLAAGTCTVTADQAGDAVYNAATQVTLNISVAKANQTISGLTADPASGVIGETSALSISSTVSVARIVQSGQKLPTTKASGIPVTYGSSTLSICTVAGSTVSYLAVGTCTVTADQAGDANYNPAPQLTLDINVTEPPPVIPNVPVPTLSLWGLMAMFLMMLGIGGMVVRRKKSG